ncbi:MAG TPA: ATP-dependent RNA helicase HrpA [Mycobacteriales bacterium]
MSTPPSPPSLADLGTRLGSLTLRDEVALGRRLEQIRRVRRPAARDRALSEAAEQITRAEGRVERRRAALPTISYPAELPISGRRADIADAIAANQVVIVAGETGSGKTTQIPKICLELGRGVRGMIGHTQPRRIAARTVADRISDELQTPLGGAVGYAVRFTDQVSDTSLVKLMTDGILLAEIQRDPRLLRYDTLIIDEAHERSLNIDFLLGYLTQLLPERPDLKIIITSATIDPKRFSDHFGGAPIVEVSGRTYPVEVRYRPLVVEGPAPQDPNDPDDPDGDEVGRVGVRDQVEGIIDAVRELGAEGSGDILVFLSGEREIRDTADALRALRLPGTEVLPLYARLSTAEQHKVFAAHDTRRIVLATNVAETSLTVPGIHYVIDPGTARISRYSHRTKVQRLPIEAISQASANQRAGRCGRTADGICIRLYSAEDYAGRSEFTEPEILRTSLASVILQMTALGLGDLEKFPFVQPPDRRSVRAGIQLLQELGALDPEQPDPRRRLTDIGRQLAQLPVDPRLGRMIVEAGREACVREVLVIAAALSIPDPRERPADQQEAAAQKHARFADEHSDFVSFLNLWTYLQDQRNERSGNQFRRMCREEFLHYLRIREWQDLVGQLRQIAKSLGITESDQPADPQRIHSAVLSGLLSHVGLRAGESREYQGARNARFVLAPGSVLTRRPPRWVVAAELVETGRLYARVAARVDPGQVERLADHLVARIFSEPQWDRSRGAVMALERVTLYGVPLVAGRRVNYGGVDAEISRELFIRHALVEGDWNTHHEFFHDNRAMLAEVAELEDRTRRRDLLVGDEELFDFYDRRLPPEVVSSRHFDSWWKKTRRSDPQLLTLRREDLLDPKGSAADAQDHPDVWSEGGLSLPVSYRFEPGAEDDGVTVHVPMDVLARVGGADFGWQVPALRQELVTALIRSLPKQLRRRFVPAADTARAVLNRLTPGQEPLLDAVQRELHRMTGVLVPRDAFSFDRVPEHLRVTFAVEDTGRHVVARGKDLDALRSDLAGQVRETVADATGAGVERDGLRDWPEDLDPLPQVVEQVRAGHTVRGYPALIDAGGTAAVRVLASQSEQRAAMASGTRRLLRLVVPSPVKALRRGLGTRARLVLGMNPDGGVGELLDDCADAAVDAIVARHGGPAWDRASYGALRDAVRAELPQLAQDLVAHCERILAAASEVRAALPAPAPPTHADAVADMRAQLDSLLPQGFVTATGVTRLPHLVRYVNAIGRRLDKLPGAVEADRTRTLQVRQVQQAYNDLLAALPPTRAAAADVRDIRWMIEELRVSLFAQQLGTAQPVSEQRIYRALDAVTP